MDGDSIIYGGLRGPRDLVPASTRYAGHQRDVTTWRSDNVEAEQLERAEKARYGGGDRPRYGEHARERRMQRGHCRAPSTRDARWRDFEYRAVAPMRSSVAPYQIFHFSTLRGTIYNLYIYFTYMRDFLSEVTRLFEKRKLRLKFGNVRLTIVCK